MSSFQLTAVSPIDGRYGSQTEPLIEYFSEYALIKYRFTVEARYLLNLVEILPQLMPLRKSEFVSSLERKIKMFSLHDAERVKEIEKVTNHDVKSVEIFMRELLHEYPKECEFIHYALTSFDTDGIARPLMLKDAHERVMSRLLSDVLSSMEDAIKKWSDIPMLARTHGQPASPTFLGKEIKVFAERVKGQIKLMNQIPWSAKFGGANGNLNAHYVAYRDINWIDFADQFVASLGLVRTKVTTQIEPNDNLAAYCDAWKRINNILIDFVRDIWTYIMLEYLKQKPKDGEVGSSTMPHKVNPIDFENAEGNLGWANAMFEHLADKLTKSRLQRDLSDSTVVRNMGVPLAHTIIAFKAILKGMTKIEVNAFKIYGDLTDNWAVVSEAIQTILRREGYPSSYDVLKQLTRTGEKITKEHLHAFIDGLDVDESIRIELRSITPWNYTGYNLCY
ncbi:MAG: adenylosuccinate lyase [bacterium]